MPVGREGGAQSGALGIVVEAEVGDDAGIAFLKSADGLIDLVGLDEPAPVDALSKLVEIGAQVTVLLGADGGGAAPGPVMGGQAMTSSCNVATLIKRYYTERLMRQRNVSANTIASYRDTFRLPFVFARARLHKPQSALARSLIWMGLSSAPSR